MALKRLGIESTNSVALAEAIAILLAIQQINKLAYKIIFLSVCVELIRSLDHSSREGRKQEVDINEATPTIQDILNLAKWNSFCFYYGPINLVHYVDLLEDQV